MRLEQSNQRTKEHVKDMRVCVVTDVELHRCLTYTTFSLFISSRHAKTHRVSITFSSHPTCAAVTSHRIQGGLGTKFGFHASPFSLTLDSKV